MTGSCRSAKSPSSSLPDQLSSIRDRVHIGLASASHTQASITPDAFSAYGTPDYLTLDSFKRDLSIDIIRLSDDCVIFDLIGVEAPIANALRRILLSEVPTMAIEKVILFQNTSIIQDEVLCHRLGLLPINVDPSKFEYLNTSMGGSGIMTPLNTTVMTLDVKCTRRPNVPDTAADTDKYVNSLIHSRQLHWVPQGAKQATRFADAPIGMCYDDIVVAKLRPGQSIEAECYIEKGIGRQHAKWSPVATASYRLMPEILIREPIEDEDAAFVANRCPMNVFDIEEIDSLTAKVKRTLGRQHLCEKQADNVTRRAVVARPRNCTMCRECIRGDPKWQEKIALRRVRNHYIFSVETVGNYEPVNVVRTAIKVLKDKVLTVKRHLNRKGEIDIDQDDDGLNSDEAAESDEDMQQRGT